MFVLQHLESVCFSKVTFIVCIVSSVHASLLFFFSVFLLCALWISEGHLHMSAVTLQRGVSDSAPRTAPVSWAKRLRQRRQPGQVLTGDTAQSAALAFWLVGVIKEKQEACCLNVPSSQSENSDLSYSQNSGPQHIDLINKNNYDKKTAFNYFLLWTTFTGMNGVQILHVIM